MEIPAFLVEMLTNQYGKTLADEIIAGYSLNKKTTFRVNTLKGDINQVVENLNAQCIGLDNGVFINSFIVNDGNISETIEFNNGLIYLQSLSSMIPPLVLGPKDGADILDMAAAPGSKTSQLCALTNNSAHIMAVEVNKIRFDRLKYNCDKLGCKNINFMNVDAKKLDDFFRFDQILLDAPCSGSGTINSKDKISISKDLVYNSARLQTELLKKAIKMLKPGGELVYSTCSILNIENEMVVKKCLNDVEIIPINNDFTDNLPLLPCEIDGAIVVKPTELYEGFFVVKLKKK